MVGGGKSCKKLFFFFCFGERWDDEVEFFFFFFLGAKRGGQRTQAKNAKCEFGCPRFCTWAAFFCPCRHQKATNHSKVANQRHQKKRRALSMRRCTVGNKPERRSIDAPAPPLGLREKGGRRVRCRSRHAPGSPFVLFLHMMRLNDTDNAILYAGSVKKNAERVACEVVHWHRFRSFLPPRRNGFALRRAIETRLRDTLSHSLSSAHSLTSQRKKLTTSALPFSQKRERGDQTGCAKRKALVLPPRASFSLSKKNEQAPFFFELCFFFLPSLASFSSFFSFFETAQAAAQTERAVSFPSRFVRSLDR